MILNDLPLYIGALKTPLCPDGIPSTYPFEFYVDNSMGIVRQKPNSNLLSILDNVYELGMLIGTPLSDGPHMAYALQWLFFGGLIIYGRILIRRTR